MDSEIIGEDFLDFKCPHCGALNSFSTSAAGLTRECMNCLDLLLVPIKDGEPGRKFPLPLEASRVRLRNFQASDWQDLLQYQFKEEDEATGWIHSVSTVRSGDTRQPVYLAVESREANRVVATLGLTFLDLMFNQVELSLVSNAAAKSTGLELEALEAALDFCFQELNLHRVISQWPAGESERRKVLTELGMRQEAEFVKQWYGDGEWISTVWFAMLEEEYFKDAPGHGISS